MDNVAALFGTRAARQPDTAGRVNELESDPHLHQKLRDFTSAKTLSGDDLALFHWLIGAHSNVSISGQRT